MLLPPVVGFKLFGALKEGCTATDLVLTITQILRKKGVVGKFVEFYGSGLSALSLADRATVANMAPEYGATVGFFPIDEETLFYLRASNRPEELVNLVEVYAKEQGLFRTDDLRDPLFSDSLELDLAQVVPSMAGPKRPQDKVTLPDVPANFQTAFKDQLKKKGALEIGDFSGNMESGDHQLHQHIQSFCDDGRRAPCQEGGRERIDLEAVGEDQSRARFQGGLRLPHEGRPDALPRSIEI